MIDPEIEIDFDKAAYGALQHAQFSFPMRPISLNNYLVPKMYGKGMTLSADAQNFKTQAVRHLWRQKPLLNWVCKPRYFSFWTILRSGHDVCEAMDVDNCNSKMLLDSFVNAGIVPDDKYCRDTRQLYGDFSKVGRVPNSATVCVLVRWGPLLNIRKE